MINHVITPIKLGAGVGFIEVPYPIKGEVLQATVDLQDHCVVLWVRHLANVKAAPLRRFIIEMPGRPFPPEATFIKSVQFDIQVPAGGGLILPGQNGQQAVSKIVNMIIFVFDMGPAPMQPGQKEV